MSTATYKKVLIVDDNEMDLMVSKMILSTTNFAEEVVTKQTGLEAINYLAENYKDPSSPIPDFIFLDINMPIMGGFEFLQRFDELPAEVTEKSKVIMVSSSEDMRDLQKASTNKHVKGYLLKPLDLDEIKNFQSRY